MEKIDFETKYVKDVYNNIAYNFDVTRQYYWKYVKKYLDNLHELYCIHQTKILDLGCGNGRYIPLMNNFDVYCVDNCEKLLDIVCKKYPTVKRFISNVTNLPFDNCMFDHIISVAVIHHLYGECRRIKMIEEIFRVLKTGGTALITAWSTQLKIKDDFQKLNDKNDYMIPWNHGNERFYHLFEMNEFEELINKSSCKDLIYVKEKVFECDNWCIVITKI